MEQLPQKFESIYDEISNSKFLSMEALGGEVPFYVSSYDATKEFEATGQILILAKKLRANGIGVACINLFELCTEILRKDGFLEEIISQEEELKKTDLLDVLSGTLDVPKYIIPALKEALANVHDAKVLILHGIGQVYPFIRSHILLNNLQNAVKEIPTVMFYPGIYSGNSFRLFGILDNDNYYRAFNLDTLIVRKKENV